LAERLARPKDVIASRLKQMDINELTYNINGAIFEVNRELGVGFLEKVYAALLSDLLMVRIIRVNSLYVSSR